MSCCFLHTSQVSAGDWPKHIAIAISLSTCAYQIKKFQHLKNKKEQSIHKKQLYRDFQENIFGSIPWTIVTLLQLRKT